MPVLDQVLQRGEDFLVGQVACRTKKHQRIGMVLVQGGVSGISDSPSRGGRFEHFSPPQRKNVECRMVSGFEGNIHVPVRL